MVSRQHRWLTAMHAARGGLPMAPRQAVVMLHPHSTACLSWPQQGDTGRALVPVFFLCCLLCFTVTSQHVLPCALPCSNIHTCHHISPVRKDLRYKLY